jgi:palmitoyltransferase ZDHHC4
MGSTVTLAVSLTCYVAFLVAVLWFCVFADPNDSPTAQFLTATLPRKLWTGLERVLGPKSLTVVAFFVDRILLVVYCTIVFGSWSIIFAYIYPWIDRQEYLGRFHKFLGALVFGACVASWWHAHKSSPGIITAKSIARYDHFPYDHLMYEANVTCRTRNIPRLARSKFDRFLYDDNVARFDHFCGWIYNTVGEENYRWFLLFLLVHAGMCLYGTYCVGCLFYGEILATNLLHATFFDSSTGEEIGASRYIIFQYMFSRHLAEAAVLLIMLVMSVALGLFLLYHCWLTSRNLTTNESYKYDQIMRWYKRELRRYKDAVKNGQGTAQNGTSQPVVPDGDVTCTSSSSTSNPGEQHHDKNDDETIAHPGPRPVNLYNRGMIENWKEVLFPLSLRNGSDQTRVATNKSKSK